MVNDPAGSEQAVTRAVALLDPLGDLPRLALASTYLAAIMKLTDRPDEAIAQARQALELGERTGSGTSSPTRSTTSARPAGPGRPWRRGPPAALGRGRPAAAHYEYTQRAYTNLVEGLYRQGRFRELDHPLAEGWPTPASTASPPTSTTWRRTAACC